jgi:hypothetical protein
MPTTKDDELEEGEALDCIFKGLKYFFIHHPKKTILTLILIFGALGYVLHDYIASEKVHLLDAVPISEQFTLMPQIYAQANAPEIRINGKVYGYQDTDFQLYKVLNQDKILVYVKSLNYAFYIDGSFLSKEYLLNKSAK